VNDIVVEVARQIGSLNRQAAKARRYGRLREELRAREIGALRSEGPTLDAGLARLCSDEPPARSLEAESSARLATLEAEVVAERLSLEDAVRSGREAADALHQLEIEIDRGEARVAALPERILEATETTAAWVRTSPLWSSKRLRRARCSPGARSASVEEAELSAAALRLEAHRAGRVGTHNPPRGASRIA